MSFTEFFIENIAEILDQSIEHFQLTIISLFIATVFGIGIGVFISVYQKSATVILSIVNVIQTIPSLALLGFLIPLIGIGALPAVIALFLYALLPIVRNTYTGILQVDPAVNEASIGLGMTRYQRLMKVELPLAVPVILAGIRTASVINVGIATLCALIGAGGLGESIFGGISLNNVNMILSGAIPASIMALLFDTTLGGMQIMSKRFPKTPLVALLVFVMLTGIQLWPTTQLTNFIAGFNSEFIKREDGFEGLNAVYNLPLEIREMEIALMYKALESGEVDVIDGFSTDGRVKAFDLLLLEDDKHYFPPYYGAPLVKFETLDKYPQLESALEKLSGILSNEKMSLLNAKIDQDHLSPEEVASTFLTEIGIKAKPVSDIENAHIVIGSKAFTENYLLAYIMGQLIEAETGLTVNLKLGFGGTKLVFDALNNGEIHLYPEYTGTGLLVLLDTPVDTLNNIIHDKEKVYGYVSKQFKNQYGIKWLPEFGFNNTFALMMRRKHAQKLGIKSISDLSKALQNNKK